MSPKRVFDAHFREREFEYGRSQRVVSADVWDQLRSHDLTMRPLGQADFDPQAPNWLETSNEAGIVLTPAPNSVEVLPWTPDPKPNGWIAGVEVRSKEPLYGTLVVQLREADVGRVHWSTIRTFRFIDEGTSFALSAFSGTGPEGLYAWARIAGPGRYGIIGLDSDPVFLQVLQALAAAHHLSSDAEFDERLQVTDGVVVALLHASEVRRWLSGPNPISDISAVARRGFPTLPFDSGAPHVTAEELHDLARRFADDPDPPELQLLESLSNLETHP